MFRLPCTRPVDQNVVLGQSPAVNCSEGSVWFMRSNKTLSNLANDFFRSHWSVLQPKTPILRTAFAPLTREAAHTVPSSPSLCLLLNFFCMKGCPYIVILLAFEDLLSDSHIIKQNRFSECSHPSWPIVEHLGETGAVQKSRLNQHTRWMN